MSNTDAEILSAVFCHPLNELSKVTVAHRQKWLKDRQMLTNVVQAESWGLQRELLAHDSSAILSTDLSAASPSLLHPGRGNSWWAEIRELSHPEGVRQGDPSSMALFCRCMDPVLPWIQQTLPAHIALCLAFADDCVFGMVDVFRSTTAVWRTLLVLESAIGLALNFRRCTVLICGRVRKEEVSDMMFKEARGLELVGVSFAIKYLGLYVGPDAAGMAWSAPLPKFVTSCAMLRQLAPGYAMAVSTCLVMCLSVLRFVLQVEAVTKQ
eukprot:3625444-Pyramimonas_sp.AAC.1